jgi:hypothetical protein
VLDDTVLLTIFLSAVQSDGVMFHPQWRSVTKSLHHQPCNRRANQSTPLSAHFCGSRSGFVEPIEHTVLNVLYKGVSVVHTSLYTESSFAVFLVVICRLSRMSLSARSRNARVASAAVGRPERRASTSSAWPFAETAIREARRTVLLTTALTPYTFFNRLWMSITDPFAMKNSVTVRCLKRTSPYNLSDRSKIVQLGLLNCRQHIINYTLRARVKRMVQRYRTWSCGV